MRKKEDAQKHRDKRTYALHVGMVWGQSKESLERANNSHGRA